MSSRRLPRQTGRCIAVHCTRRKNPTRVTDHRVPRGAVEPLSSGVFKTQANKALHSPVWIWGGESSQAGELTDHLWRFLLTRVTAWFKMFSPEQHLPLQLIFLAESRNVIVMQYNIQHHRTIIFTSAHFLIKIPIWAHTNDAKLWNSYQDSSWKTELCFQLVPCFNCKVTRSQ